MKKLFALILVLMLIFVLCACNDSQLPNDDNQQSQSENNQQTPIDNDSVDTIVDLTKSGEIMTDDALECFFSDDRYSYYFPSIMSRYIIVYYKDGTEQNVKDALAEGKIKISDLDLFGILYYKEPIK